MPSAKSYFNLTLYRKHLTRFWPIWAVYTLMWLFYMPVNLIINSGNPWGAEYVRQFADRTVLRSIPQYGLAMSVFFGLITAMAVWSYLYNNRSVSFIHALPIRREGLFFTGAAAGATFFVVPNVVIFFLTLGAEALSGAVNLNALLIWFAAQTMLCLFFFCFATLCGFVTGHILVLPAFFWIFNFLTMGILGLVENALHNFVYGFAGITAAWPIAQKLSPMYRIGSSLTVSTLWGENNLDMGVQLEGVSTLAAYLAVGVVMMAVALLLYRRQDLERAGEVVTVDWLRPVFKYGVAFCGALSFGTLTYEIFSGRIANSAWGMLVFVLLWGFLSYLAAEMLLQKSFRVLKKSWKGCVVFLAALVVVTAAMELDLTGYERRVPAASQIQSAIVTGLYTLPQDSAGSTTIEAKDTAMIARLLSLHQASIDDKKQAEQLLYSFRRGDYSGKPSESFYSEQNSVSFTLVYTLSNGRELRRSYTLPVTAALLADPASPAALLEDLLNSRGDASGRYFPSEVTAKDFVGGAVSFRILQNAQNGYEESYKESYEEVSLSAEQAGVLFEAAGKDLAAGTLGRRYLMERGEYERQVYSNEITLIYYGYFPGWGDQEQPDTQRAYFYPQADSVHLISALRELGILDESHQLITWQEVTSVYSKW